MYRKYAFILIFGFLLTGCGSVTEDTFQVGEQIETVTEAEPETEETTVFSEPEETTAETTGTSATETSEPETTAPTPLEQPESALMPGVHLGMSEEEVFAVVGGGYDHIYTEDFYKNTIEYDFLLDSVTIAGVPLCGYAFFEFDEDNGGLLSCYGFHFGHNGNFDAPEYPLSEEELAAVHDVYLHKMTEWYGEPGEPEFRTGDAGLRSESAWENDEGKFWLIYGVNLWGLGEPETYEQGINEVVVSCSAR